MNDSLKVTDASPIPTPLRDWLDNAIIAQISGPGTTSDDTMTRKASIANAILYPLETKPRKSKLRDT